MLIKNRLNLLTHAKNLTLIWFVFLTCFSGIPVHAFDDFYSDSEIQFIDPNGCSPPEEEVPDTTPPTSDTPSTPDSPASSETANPCATSCDTGSSATSLSGKDNVEKTVNFFMQQGLSPAQAAGVTANFMWETGGGQTINPLISGAAPTGAAFGIAQWTPPSTYINAKHQGGIQGEDKELLTQLKVVWYEMQGKGGRQSTDIIPGLKQIDNAGDAANYFRENFERCDTSNASCTTNRVNTANELVQQLGGGNVGGGSSATCVGGPAGEKGSVDAAVQAAKTLSGMKVGYVWGGSHGPNQISTDNTNELRHQGMDCSSSVSWVLHQAGMLDAGNALDSTSLMSWGEPGKGKEMTVWANEDHTFIEFNSPGVGHYRLDTSQNGASTPSTTPHATGPGPRFVPWGSRDTAGFTPRHWQGT